MALILWIPSGFSAFLSSNANLCDGQDVIVEFGEQLSSGRLEWQTDSHSCTSEPTQRIHHIFGSIEEFFMLCPS